MLLACFRPFRRASSCCKVLSWASSGAMVDRVLAVNSGAAAGSALAVRVTGGPVMAERSAVAAPATEAPALAETRGAAEVARVTSRTEEILTKLHTDSMERIDQFVSRLSDLRSVRGEIISLKDLRYVNLSAVESLENKVTEETENLSGQCVEFLLKPESLEPYDQRVVEIRDSVESLERATEAVPYGYLTGIFRQPMCSYSHPEGRVWVMWSWRPWLWAFQLFSRRTLACRENLVSPVSNTCCQPQSPRRSR